MSYRFSLQFIIKIHVIKYIIIHSDCKMSESPNNDTKSGIKSDAKSDTKWLYINSSIIIEKDQIKQCAIKNVAGDVYNIECMTKDGKSLYIIPECVSWSHAMDVLGDIHRQIK